MPIYAWHIRVFSCPSLRCSCCHLFIMNSTPIIRVITDILRTAPENENDFGLSIFLQLKATPRMKALDKAIKPEGYQRYTFSRPRRPTSRPIRFITFLSERKGDCISWNTMRLLSGFCCRSIYIFSLSVPCNDL